VRESEEDYKRTLESEKARAIVWFAVLAIIATVRESVHETDLWNFPCNSPCIHLSLYAAQVLANWIYLWLGYGGCMLVYFSEDWFQKWGEQGRAVREIMRKVGNRVFLYFYPLTLLWFSATAEGSFFLPPWIQGYYWLAVGLPMSVLVIWTIEGVFGRKIVGKRGMISEAADLFLKLGAEGAAKFGEGLAQAVKRAWARIRNKPIGPRTQRSVKVANLLFVTCLSTGVGAITWLLVGLNIWILIDAVGVTLWLFVFVLVFVAILKRKDSMANETSNSA
jgi:hypothetical protein